jgi:hypothetical protein
MMLITALSRESRKRTHDERKEKSPNQNTKHERKKKKKKRQQKQNGNVPEQLVRVVEQLSHQLEARGLGQNKLPLLDAAILSLKVLLSRVVAVQQRQHNLQCLTGNDPLGRRVLVATLVEAQDHFIDNELQMGRDARIPASEKVDSSKEEEEDGIIH